MQLALVYHPFYFSTPLFRVSGWYAACLHLLSRYCHITRASPPIDRIGQQRVEAAVVRQTRPRDVLWALLCPEAAVYLLPLLASRDPHHSCEVDRDVNCRCLQQHQQQQLPGRQCCDYGTRLSCMRRTVADGRYGAGRRSTMSRSLCLLTVVCVEPADYILSLTIHGDDVDDWWLYRFETLSLTFAVKLAPGKPRNIRFFWLR